jgi:3' terminal RNA ribose 2'-O-methyltransferase Hen1
MLLTLTTTHQPATDLGYLLHKHPDRLQSFELPFGKAQVFYPVATASECTMALLLDVNAVDLTRGKSGSSQPSIADYVSDRPYVASSFMSVALSKIFGTAMSGTCQHRPELPSQPLPFRVHIPVLPSHGGEKFLQGLFAPLGYEIKAQRLALDEQFPAWGQSRYFDLELHQTITLTELLSHLYVLMPVLDDYKHYFVNEEEMAKLLRHGEGWLSHHPLREDITRRYLKRKRGLAEEALAQMAGADAEVIPVDITISEEAEEAIEKPLSLNQQRMQMVVSVLKQHGAKRVVDLGCGEGKLLKLLLADLSFQEILGMDVTYRALEIAQRRLKIDRSRSVSSAESPNSRLTLIQGSLTYRDDRIAGYDAATVIEVIEHMDLNRLGALERVLFEFAKPRLVIVTTPNVEYNANFPGLPAGKMRHHDHRFEWTRAEFETWAAGIVDRYQYQVSFQPIGDLVGASLSASLHPSLGAPTQMAIFTALV